MQVWRRQPSQCIFCMFQQLKVASRIGQNVRHYSRSGSTQNEGKLRIRKSGGVEFRKERGRQNIAEVFESGRRGKRKPLINYAAAGRAAREERKEANAERSLPSNIDSSLEKLHTRLVDEKNADKDGRTEMQVLDPERRMWPKYRDYVASLHKRVRSLSASKKDSILWDLLVKSAKKSTSSGEDADDITTELYFGFLDYTLKPMDTNQLREIAHMPIDLRYPTEWYAAARKAQRTIHLHIGPTNSGKTYHALKRLQEAKDGFYAGPLRLLAHEVYSRFNASGIACDLLTGDDVRYDDDPNTKVYASTVEMVKTGQEVEVAVIDEIQMMASEDRGWAWTRAFLGARANEVHLCGEERVLPLIRELSASMGDTLKVHQYKRLNPLRCTSKSLRGDFSLLRKGDCVVAFSIVNLHQLKKTIELETGKRCAIVYGSLPPETRAQQAELFNNPDNDYDFLVASDAIGMGLNLSVKRIIFNSVTKWDGTKFVELSIPQIKQIAGRAGRYRSAHQAIHKTSKSTDSTAVDEEETVGLVTCLDEADLPVIRRALATEAPPLKKAGIVPPAEYLEEYSTRVPASVPFEYLLRKVCHAATIHPRFFLCDIRDRLELARLTDDIPNLSIEQRVNLTAAPRTRNSPSLVKALRAIARSISQNTSVTIVDLDDVPLEVLSQPAVADRTYLESLENLHHCIILYLWLSYRFQNILRDQPMAIHAKELTEQKINWTLSSFSASPKIMARLKKLQKQDKEMQEAKLQAKAKTDTHITSPVSSTQTKEQEQERHTMTELLQEVGVATNSVDDHLVEPTIASMVNTDGPINTTTEENDDDADEKQWWAQSLAETNDESIEEHFAKPSSEISNHGTPSLPKTSNLDVAGHEDEWVEKSLREDTNAAKPTEIGDNDSLATPAMEEETTSPSSKDGPVDKNTTDTRADNATSV